METGKTAPRLRPTTARPAGQADSQPQGPVAGASAGSDALSSLLPAHRGGLLAVDQTVHILSGQYVFPAPGLSNAARGEGIQV